eukprot:scaffold91988_cov26-Tisochrysis_lutea.AAC.1
MLQASVLELPHPSLPSLIEDRPSSPRCSAKRLSVALCAFWCTTASRPLRKSLLPLFYSWYYTTTTASLRQPSPPGSNHFHLPAYKSPPSPRGVSFVSQSPRIEARFSQGGVASAIDSLLLEWLTDWLTRALSHRNLSRRVSSWLSCLLCTFVSLHNATA